MVDMDGEYMDAFCGTLGETLPEATEDGSMKVAACMLHSVS
jgi:hypothetical protein